MGKFIDLTGQRFGRLTVIERVGTNKRREALWLCLCVCGNEKIVSGSHLRRGSNKSCGCLNKEERSKRAAYSRIGDFARKHGLSDTRVYRIYHAMKRRCYNPHIWNYDKYGGRGIKICDEWLNDFMSFYNWAMANGYDDTKSIDRIDVNGNYEPSNCRWVSASIQQYNRNKQSNNTTGHVGVAKLKNGRYRAYIKKNGKQIALGVHDTLEEAIQARIQGEMELY